MGKTLFIKELKKEGDAFIFSDIFLVTNKSLLRTNAGKPYLALTLKDASGEIEGRVWDNVPEISGRFKPLDYVTITGSVVSHLGKYQVKVLDLKEAEEGAIDPSDFLPSSARPVEMMWKDLETLVDSLKGEEIRKFLQRVFSHPDVAMKMKAAPAGKKLHHDWVGGLLEHTLSVVEICDFLSRHYPGVDRDMLIAGALLHDIGKIYELSFDRGFDYTDEGRLIGHISMGSELVTEIARKDNLLSEEKEMLLKHIILSHHGEFEYGSPRRPKTIEALIVHMVENMDSKVNAFYSVIKNSENDSAWSDYQRMFNRFLYIKRE